MIAYIKRNASTGKFDAFNYKTNEPLTGYSGWKAMTNLIRKLQENGYNVTTSQHR